MTRHWMKDLLFVPFQRIPSLLDALDSFEPFDSETYILKRQGDRVNLLGPHNFAPLPSL